MCDDKKSGVAGHRVTRSTRRKSRSSSPRKGVVITTRNESNRKNTSPPTKRQKTVSSPKKCEISEQTMLANLKLGGFAVTAIGGQVLLKQMPYPISDKLNSEKYLGLVSGTCSLKPIDGSQNGSAIAAWWCRNEVDNSILTNRPPPIDHTKHDIKLRMSPSVSLRRIPRQVSQMLESRTYVDLTEIISVKPQRHDVPEIYMTKVDNNRESSDHICSPECGRMSLNLIPELLKRNVSPLVLPYYYGWTRAKETSKRRDGRYRSRTKVSVVYVAPCGFKFTKYKNVRKFLYLTNSCLEIDAFCFQPKLNCLVEMPPSVPSSFFIFEEDISNGQELRKVERVNSLDLEPATALEYIANSVFGPNVTRNDYESKFFTCCECEDDCQDRDKCSCWQLTLQNEAVLNPKDPSTNSIQNVGYTNQKKLLKKVEGGIFECNEGCKCKSSCVNRIVQKGLTWRLQVFNTKNRGYAVRAMEEIPQGSFVCIYAGELIKNVDADKVGVLLGTGYAVDLIAGFEYKHIMAFTRWMDEHAVLSPLQEARQKLLNLEGTVDERFVVDAKRKGNVGRYFNHSCRPNLFVQPVFVETHDLRLPRAAFFTTEVIKCGTELAWHYGYDVGSFPGNEKICHCGAIGCKKRFL